MDYTRLPRVNHVDLMHVCRHLLCYYLYSYIEVPMWSIVGSIAGEQNSGRENHPKVNRQLHLYVPRTVLATGPDPSILNLTGVYLQ